MFCRRVDCAIIYGARMAFFLCEPAAADVVLAVERPRIVSLQQFCYLAFCAHLVQK